MCCETRLLTSEALTEVDVLGNSIERRRVVVRALLGSSRSTKHVGNQSGVADLLIGHELNERSLLCVDTILLKLSIRESNKTVMLQGRKINLVNNVRFFFKKKKGKTPVAYEEIELNPLLMESKGQ